MRSTYDGTLLGIAIALTLLCMWIVLPPFAIPALIAVVVAIEWSPFLLALNAIVLLLLLRARTWRRSLAVGLTILNLVLCAIPGIALLAVQHADGTFLPATPHPAGAIAERNLRVGLPDFVPTIREYSPSQPNGCPPVIFAIYGGAWQRGSAANDASLNRALAGRGYEVFALDYRHAPAFHFPAPLNDINREIDWVAQRTARRSCGPPRIALLGHSAGGELAMVAAFTRPDIRAVVSYSGPIDLDQAYQFPPQPDPLDVRALLRAYLGGPPDVDRAAYRAASPLRHVREHLPATLLIYAGRDHVVDIRAPMELRDSLQAHGDDVTFVVFPWAEHGFEDVPFGLHGRFALNAVDAFLSRTLAKQPAKQ
jgi:acetyl esterase/lipase